MKASNYNFIHTNFLDGSDQAVIYNSRTGALAVLEKENYDQLKAFQECNSTIHDKEFEKQLENCGYIVEDTFDELQQIKCDMLRSRFNSSFMSLTIAPTMACNFRCIYCFEKGQYHNQVMSKETSQDIINFIRRNINHLDKLTITWYGGEPLLAMNQIVDISHQVLAICKEFNVEYNSSIITNGYLLNAETVSTLKDCGVKDIQITIDGPKDIHDQRRPLANGSGTFDVIMNNLVAIKGMIPIFIRINADYENWQQLNQIVKLLRVNELIEHVTVYLGLVTPSNENYESNKCLSDEKYSKFNLKFMQENDIPLMHIYPSPKGNYCTADQCNSWVIDPLGHLYKCWSDIGIKERRIGTVVNNENVSINKMLLNDYLLYDPTKDDRCIGCKYIPICLGGCPHNRMEKLNICAQYKYNLDEYMKECTKILIENC